MDIDWKHVFLGSNVSESYTELLEILTDVFGKFVPLKTTTQLWLKSVSVNIKKIVKLS